MNSLVVEPVETKPDARGHNQVALLLLGAMLASAVNELFQRTVQAEVEGHPHRMSGRQPSALTPGRKDNHG